MSVSLVATLAGVGTITAALAEGQPAKPTPRPGTMAALRADVKATGDRLAAATTAWEKGQVALGILVQRKISTGRELDQLAVDTETAKTRISSFANSLYRNPIDPMITAVMTGSASAISDVQFIKRALGQTSTGQRRDARTLQNRVLTTQALLNSQGDAALQAIRLQARLEAQLTALQGDAQRSLERLQAAIAEVHRREAAAAAAAATAAGATAPAGGGGPGCSGPVPADAVNGFLPDSALCPLRTARGHRLVAGAAAAFDSMSDGFRAAFGTPLCITDSYRDYATQVQVFKTKPNLAATPGRSQHGWGRAVDLCGGVQNYGTPPYQWLKANAATFGFTHPDWAEPDGSKPEPWHWEFQG